MDKINTIEEIVKRIDDPAVSLVAQNALKNARKAMDFPEHSRVSFVADETAKIIPKALKMRASDET